MVTFSKNETGVWTMTLDETDAEERNAVFDEAVPRYLNAFDPAFVRAAEVDEAEFVKALLRISSVQEAGWDPYETTLRAVPAMQTLHSLIPEGDEWYETSRHLALWTYGHVIEASEPYARCWPICLTSPGAALSTVFASRTYRCERRARESCNHLEI
jgi:hypothetical protein